MPEGQVLEFSGVTKRFGAVTAVEDFSARVLPGAVTGFLGPNGAGKTTSLRILLGLVRATDGTATIGGLPYAKLAQPLRTVGAVLEASSFHPGRTAANHLRVYARAAGISDARVDEVLGLVGLADAGGRKVGGFSLGMRQRLGLAYALLGDPGVLVLDEPANGLDPEGIRWMRQFLRQLAREGRTVLVSSHLLTEVQQTVDSLVVIAQGRLVFQGELGDLADPSEYATVVDSPDRAALTAALNDAGVAHEVLRSGLTVRTLDPAGVGAIAASAGVALSSLQRRGPALEEVFLELVRGERVYSVAPAAAAEASTSPPDPEQTGETAAPEAAGAADVADEPVLPEEELEPALAAADEATAPPAEAQVPMTTAAFAVASTGVIDIIPPDEDDADAGSPPAPDETDDPALPEDADPDVEAIAEIDEELSEPDAEPVGSDDGYDASEPGVEPGGTREAPSEVGERPFDAYEKTEADHDADAFFAAYDAAQREDAERDAAARSAGAGNDEHADADSEHPAEADPESEHHVEPEADGDEGGDPR